MKKLSKQVTLGIDPMTGKRIRKRIYADSPSGLKQAEKNLIAEHARTGSVSHMTYKAYEDNWWDANCTNIEPVTQAAYRTALRKNKPLLYIEMSRITRNDLQAVINANWNHPAECKKYVTLMRSIWRSAVFDGVVIKDITVGLKTPKKAVSVRRPLSDAELSAIKTAHFTQQEQFLVDVLLQFGLRPGEALALDRTAFNRRARTLTISKSLAWNVSEPFVKTTKTGVTRVLPVPDSFWSKLPQISGMYYFADEDGKLPTKRQADRLKLSIIDKINAELGGTKLIRVTDMTMYTFRHHKASLLYYTVGISTKKKAQYMGHSEEMFIKTYSHMMEDKEDVEILRQEVI